MPCIQVDFYLLTEDTPEAYWVLACRLLEKAYLQNLSAWVWCSNETHAAMLDSTLWTFKEDSFIPHARDDEQLPQRPPIEIATRYPNACTAKLLLNLSGEVAKPSLHLTRILEIVSPTETEKAKSRTHYRAYRQKGYEVNTHQINLK